MGLTDFGANHLLLRFPQDKILVLSLLTGDPSDTFTGKLISGGGYMNAIISGWSRDNPRELRNNQAITFPVATADWGIITHVAIRDQLSNYMWHGPLETPVTINKGDRFTIDRFNLILSL